MFQKRITTDYTNILLVSNTEYSQHTHDQFEIYCISSEYSRIFCNKD